MMEYLFFIILGYLSGSILYARVFGNLLKHENFYLETKDGNPGTANAFMQGGFFCGVSTLCGDMMKGFLPVFLAIRVLSGEASLEMGIALVIFAPVLGHVFPIFYHFKGGKGIATTFGCLLGCMPNIFAACVLAFFFILLSLVIRVTPHLYRTFGTYWLTLLTLMIFKEQTAILIGFFLIALCVSVRLHMSKEEKEKCKVRLLWIH